MASAQPTNTNPYLGYLFSVNVAGIGTAAFSEATLSSVTVNTTSYREGTDSASLTTLPGLVSYGNVTLKKGVTNSIQFFKWVQSVLQKGTDAAQNMTISVIDGPGSSSKILASWNFRGVFPIGYEVSPFDASSSGVLLETLVLSVGDMERKQ